jgi:hypothetical protein
MVCQHLAPLEAALIEAGAKETFRGAAWTKKCREWVYFDVVLDISALEKRFQFPACVRVHENLDPKSGLERGFACEACEDAVMGRIDGATEFR